MSEMIMPYWTNFAGYGDSNGEGLPGWPADNDVKSQCMHFRHDKAQAGPVVNVEGLRALDEYFKRRREPE